MRRIACSVWPAAWLIGMAVSLGSAMLLFSGELGNWFLFFAVQTVTSVAIFAWLRRASMRYVDSQMAAEAALWRATGHAIHDMGTPLHVVRFCIQQLIENPTVAQTPKFMEQLTRGSDRTAQTFEHLREYVRIIRDEEGPTALRSALRHAVRIAQARFPDHPGAKSIDPSGAPDEMITMGGGPLVRSLAVLLGRCLGNPGIVKVAVEPVGDQLQIGIFSDSKRDCTSYSETRSVRRWVGEWGGKLSRTTANGTGFGYALRLEREGRG